VQRNSAGRRFEHPDKIAVSRTTLNFKFTFLTTGEHKSLLFPETGFHQSKSSATLV
jgi:hypothetical protein